MRKRRRLPLPSELYTPYLDTIGPEAYPQEPLAAVPKRMRSTIRDTNGWGHARAADGSPSPRHSPHLHALSAMCSLRSRLL